MLGDIDLSKKPVTPKLFLARPNRKTIAKLTEAYELNIKVTLGGINELSFKLPYDVDLHHNLEKNINIDMVKERYLLRVEVGTSKEWYVITKINDNADEDADYRTIQAFSLPYMLRDKIIRDVTLESKNAKQALAEALKSTVWSIDYIDADFELKYRSFQVDSKSVLDFVIQIAETFNAILIYDTENCKVSMRKPNLVGTNKGLSFSYGYYLKTLGKESNTDEMVTRLKVFGSDGMSIQRVNPTGQNYIESFSYFMFPFAQDADGNVIEHSNYMSDDLCKSIITFNALVDSKKGQFSTLLSEKKVLDDQLLTKNRELTDLNGEKDIILDTKDLQQADETWSAYEFNYLAVPVTKSMDLEQATKYVVMAKVDSVDNIEIKVNGLSSILVAGQWTLLQKLQITDKATVVTSGTALSTLVKLQINAITDEEFAGSKDVLNDDGEGTTKVTITNDMIIDKYGLNHKQMQIDAKQSEIDLLKADIKVKDDAIAALKDETSMENNFTPQEITELNEYVIEKEFIDDNIIDDNDLFEVANKRFDELRMPQMVIEIDVVNFLECLEEQGNWHKLILGDLITIKYEKLNTKVQAKIIEVAYNFEEGSIKLTIANIKDILTNADKLMKYLYGSISTTTTIDMNKYKWDLTGEDLGEIDKIINQLYDKNKQMIDMAVNETVIIDRRGITIYDPNDPLRFLRATHGVLGITDDGGNTYKSAITYYGLVGERIFGKIITGERVVIGDPDGILEILGNKGIITDRNGREVMWFGLYDETNGDKFGLKLENDTNQVIVDRDDGFKITKKVNGEWVNTAWLDTNGILNVEGIKIFESEVDNIYGTLTNGIIINPMDGIVVTRSDGLVRTRLNATDGISIERWNGSVWQKKFYADMGGSLWAEDLTAKRIKIVNDFGEELLNSDTSYMNIGRFETIIVDGKLTPLEKVQLKGEWARIQSEYQLLLAQANNYSFTTRDASQRIDTTAYTAAYTALNNYIVPLLQNMDTVTDIDRNEFEAKFKAYFDEAINVINKITDSLKYSSLQLGQLYNNVLIDALDGVTVTRSDNMVRTRLNATDGISIEVWTGSMWEKRFFVDASGTMKLDTIEATRLLLKGKNGEILLDADQKVLRLDNFDMIIGKLQAENIASKVITADEGFIADLTVNHLKTVSYEDEGQETNYVDIKGHIARWVTGKVVAGSGVQATDSDGNLLYWVDSARSQLTIETTSFPAMKYQYSEVDKLKIAFDSSNASDIPFIQFGNGDGATMLSAKAFLKKNPLDFNISYFANNTGDQRKILMDNNGVKIQTDVSGSVEIFKGTTIIKIQADGTIRLEHSSGSYISIGNDIKLSSVGNLYLN